MHAAPASSLLAGYYVISLRPAGAHEGLRRAAARLGARTFALSPWRLVRRDDDVTRQALRAALDADVVLFTSQPAVHAAAALQPLRETRNDQVWLAVGDTTARALRGSGLRRVQAPARMDSEGLLALPALAAIGGRTVGLVTAPGGRGVIGPTLARKGANVRRADVYARHPISPTPARLAALRALPTPWLLPVSSAEALSLTLAKMPDDIAARLRAAHAIAASERLAARLRTLGFDDVRRAADARPAALLAAAVDSATRC